MVGIRYTRGVGHGGGHPVGHHGQTRGKPADPQIYLEATCLQNSGLEAHLVKLDDLISYLDRGSNIKRLKTA